MPKLGHRRQTLLYSVAELAALGGLSPKTIRGWASAPGVYKELHAESREGSGGKRVAYIDPATLQEDQRLKIGLSEVEYTFSSELMRKLRAGAQSSSRAIPSSEELSPYSTEQVESGRPEPSKLRAGADSAPATVYMRKIKDELSRERLALLRPILALGRGERAPLIAQLAHNLGVAERTIYRWMNQFEAEGPKALARQPRADRGRPRISTEAYNLIVHALVSNPPTSSTAIIHRTLLRAAPETMRYQRGARTVDISEATVRRVREALLDDPFMALLFSDADMRKEYLRSYAGEVVAAHANDLWQMDMTRCDVAVWWPELEKVARPRIHAIIDVYSGCVPGVVFALEENQTQTDLAILRALRPKSGPLAERYPIWGIPKRLYWDNGKTYVSAHAERYLAGLGIESVHSLPKVSHTRGRIERFFGTLHGFERTLPGYVGRDAAFRSGEEMRRLERNTRAWAGRDYAGEPGWGERLMTISEYQNAVLAWLIGEYHAWKVHDKSRLEHFLETVPDASRLALDDDELMLLMAERHVRVVRPGGTFQFENLHYAVPDGSLIHHQGRKVLVLRDQFVQDGRLLCAWEDRSGALEVIGWAEPAPDVASSLEAGELRRASKAQAQAALAEAKRLRKALTNPELIVSKQLMKEVEVVAPRDLTPRKQGRLAAVTDVEPDLGDWAKDVHELLDTKEMSPKEFLEVLDRAYSADSREEAK